VRDDPFGRPLTYDEVYGDNSAEAVSDHEVQTNGSRRVPNRPDGPGQDDDADQGRPHHALHAGEQPPEGESVTLAAGRVLERREKLAQIRQAAHSRQRGADAVLQVVLARVAAGAPFTLKLPALVGSPSPLCYFGVVLGPSGTGKGNSADIGSELVPLGTHVADQLPLGSGEGLVEVLFESVREPDPVTSKPVTVKRQIRYNAFVYVDEGDMLAAIGTRNGPRSCRP